MIKRSLAGIQNISGINKQVGTPIKSVLSHSAIKGHTSLNTIIKNVKKSNPDLTKTQQKMITKTLKRMNEDPNDSLVTKRMAKLTFKALGETGQMKQKYAGKHAKALRQMKRVAAAQKNINDAVSSINKDLGASDDKAQNTSFSRKQRAKEELKKKKRMWARARQSRREAEEEEKGIKTSIGLQEWQQSKTSIAQAVKEKEIERHEQGSDQLRGIGMPQQDEPQPAVDIMID